MQVVGSPTESLAVAAMLHGLPVTILEVHFREFIGLRVSGGKKNKIIRFKIKKMHLPRAAGDGIDGA